MVAGLQEVILFAVGKGSVESCFNTANFFPCFSNLKIQLPGLRFFDLGARRWLEEEISYLSPNPSQTSPKPATSPCPASRPPKRYLGVGGVVHSAEGFILLLLRIHVSFATNVFIVVKPVKIGHGRNHIPLIAHRTSLNKNYKKDSGLYHYSINNPVHCRLPFVHGLPFHLRLIPPRPALMIWRWDLVACVQNVSKWCWRGVIKIRGWRRRGNYCSPLSHNILTPGKWHAQTTALMGMGV